MSPWRRCYSIVSRVSISNQISPTPSQTDITSPHHSHSHIRGMPSHQCSTVWYIVLHGTIIIPTCATQYDRTSQCDYNISAQYKHSMVRYCTVCHVLCIYMYTLYCDCRTIVWVCSIVWSLYHMCMGQYSALQYSTVKHIAVHYSVIHYGTSQPKCMVHRWQYEYTALCKWSVIQVYIAVWYVCALQYAICPWYIRMACMAV